VGLFVAVLRYGEPVKAEQNADKTLAVRFLRAPASVIAQPTLNSSTQALPAQRRYRHNARWLDSEFRTTPGNRFHAHSTSSRPAFFSAFIGSFIG
jgi:hypothetical protein